MGEEEVGVRSRRRAREDWRASFLRRRAWEGAEERAERAAMYFDAIGGGSVAGGFLGSLDLVGVVLVLVFLLKGLWLGFC